MRRNAQHNVQILFCFREFFVHRLSHRETLQLYQELRDSSDLLWRGDRTISASEVVY